MLSESFVAAIAAEPWFQSLAAPFLIVDTDLRIRAINDAYEQTSGRSRQELVGVRIFDAFPNNPNDPSANGVAQLTKSLDYVFSRQATHWMGLQRYDIDDPLRPGEYMRKVWTPVNSLLRDGEAIGALHHVQDVTVIVDPDDGAELDPRSAELQQSVRRLAEQFPQLPTAQIIGVLTRSHVVVWRAFGRPSAARAEALAGLELESTLLRPTTTGR
jgi:hypothetical protein